MGWSAVDEQIMLRAMFGAMDTLFNNLLRRATPDHIAVANAIRTHLALDDIDAFRELCDTLNDAIRDPTVLLKRARRIGP
jgi:hypothetical protein